MEEIINSSKYRNVKRIKPNSKIPGSLINFWQGKTLIFFKSSASCVKKKNNSRNSLKNDRYRRRIHSFLVLNQILHQVKHYRIHLSRKITWFVATWQGPNPMERVPQALPKSKRIPLTVQAYQKNRKRKLRLCLLSGKARQQLKIRS